MLRLLIIARAQLSCGSLDRHRRDQVQRSLLIIAKDQRGQLLAARIRKKRDQPRCKIVGDEHYPSVPLRQPPGHIRRLRSCERKAGSVHARETREKSACRQAAGVYRELAAARPDVVRPDLARSLNNLSNRLAGLGRREEALAAIQEAADIRPELAAAWPDAQQHELEQSLRVVARLEQEEDLSDASPQEPKT
jgi:hypothetical protein